MVMDILMGMHMDTITDMIMDITMILKVLAIITITIMMIMGMKMRIYMESFFMF